MTWEQLWDKIRIRAKGGTIDLNDTDLTFSLVESRFGEDGDIESEPYTIKRLICDREEIRGEFDLKLQTKWKEYMRIIKEVEDNARKIKEENAKLKQKIIDKMLA